MTDVITPVPALVEPAQMALKQWRFIPTMCANEPVDAWTNVAFHIVLIRNLVGSDSAGSDALLSDLSLEMRPLDR